MTSDQIGWHHPTDESDQWDGFNEPGIEHFAGSPVRHLAREIHQNACDASSGTGTVTVKIHLRKVMTSEIPNIDELKANFQSCLDASRNESKKAEAFFENAIKELDSEKIEVLEISDYNTLGMKGPSTNGTPFYAFMKAKGQSRKEDTQASGSYGIGKFAPYAVSKLRTIFISTVFQNDEGELEQLTQGKSILMSHDKGDERKQGVGFWGAKEKCQPILGVAENLPNWLQRENIDLNQASKGSKLSVICFDKVNNWETLLATSVAENFFGAILDGNLQVEIQDKHILDQNTIINFFENNSIKELIEKEKLTNESEFDNCKHYLATLKRNIEVFTEETEQPELGNCQVKILVGERLPKKVCILRNGMFITDKLDGLKTFGDFKEFVAVFHCQSKKGNELLRAMEPPRHDDFEPERLLTKEEKRKGKKALKSLVSWIREMLERRAKNPVADVTEIDELKDFFGDEGDADSGKGMEEINPYGEVIIRAKPIKTKLMQSESFGNNTKNNSNFGDDETISDYGGGGNASAGGGDNTGGEGKGDGGTGDKQEPMGSSSKTKKGDIPSGVQKSVTDINNVRAIPSGSRTRKLAFTPVKSGKIAVYLKEAGADSDYDISIVTSNMGEITNGGVALEVAAGARIILDVELNQDFSGALKVVAYEIR
jgi:hypothetical protein